MRSFGTSATSRYASLSAGPLKTEVMRSPTAMSNAPQAGSNKIRSRYFAVQFEKLTKEYFRRVGQEMPDKAKFFLWRQKGKLIAFNYCLAHGDELWDEYLGLDYDALQHVYQADATDHAEAVARRVLVDAGRGPPGGEGRRPPAG